MSVDLCAPGGTTNFLTLKGLHRNVNDTVPGAYYDEGIELVPGKSVALAKFEHLSMVTLSNTSQNDCRYTDVHREICQIELCLEHHRGAICGNIRTYDYLHRTDLRLSNRNDTPEYFEL